MKKLPPSGGCFDVPQLESEIKKLEEGLSVPDAWADHERATGQSQRLGALHKEVDEWRGIAREAEDLFDIASLTEGEGTSDLASEIETRFVALEEKFSAMEFRLLFSGKYDEYDAIVAIHAGAGGTEAQDWAEMLLRMYFRFAERRGFVTQILDESRGTEAGIKSVTFRVRGRHAYGYLRSEHGVHRLVRISPFDGEKLRHTSFALVEVLPELEEIEEVQIDPKDVRIDTFLSSGHGGQSVQTTYSAVRVVHIPTGITVACQNERSQQQNKETAFKILKAKLHQKYLAEQDAEKQKLRGAYTSAEWGNQIRSYVLHPYQMVKDHRTKYETSDTGGVLDGKLEDFIEAYLRWSALGSRNL